MNRNRIIKWTGIGTFALTGIAIMMSVFLDSAGPASLLLIAVACFGVLALVAEVLWMYLIVPPSRGDDAKNDSL